MRRLVATVRPLNMKRYALIAALVLLFVLLGFWWLWGDNFYSSQEVNYSQSSRTEIKGSHISLAVNDILLFKAPNNDYGAIRFESVTNEPGVDYSSWFLHSSSKNMNFQGIAVYKGHVFEKYWRTRTGFNNYFVIDIGGKNKIKCGPVMIGWSALTWIYFPKSYEFTVTGKNIIDDIEVSDPSLKWHKN